MVIEQHFEQPLTAKKRRFPEPKDQPTKKFRVHEHVNNEFVQLNKYVCVFFIAVCLIFFTIANKIC